MIKTLIWIENEKIKNEVEKIIGNDLTSSFFISDSSDIKFKEIKKQMKSTDSNRVIKFSNDMTRFDIYLKSNSVWTKIKFEELVYKWFEKNNYKVSNPAWNTPLQFMQGKKEIELSFPLLFNEISNNNELIKFYLGDEALIDFNKENDNQKIFKLESNSFKLASEEHFEKFKNEIIVKNVKELRSKSFKVVDENKLEIKTENGFIFVEKNENQINYLISLEGKKISDLHFEIKALKNNLKALINQETKIVGAVRKIRKKDVIYLMVSLMAIIALMYITFSFIFTPQNSKITFEILGSSYTWKKPWIYLMIFNFIISIFLGMILSIILQWFTPGSNKKVNYKHAFNMWISLQVRQAAIFITGNAFFATFIWGLYVVKTTQTRTIGFAGMLASTHIIRGVIMIPIGALFMIRGTVYNSNILNVVGAHEQFVAYTTLSWIGWIWNIIHNISLSILIILPPLHILYNKGQEVYYNGKNYSIDQMTDKMSEFEMQIRSLKSSLPNMFKNTKRIVRIISIILIGILIETFEFTYSVRMVEDYAINVLDVETFTAARYMNIFAISSVRYMTSFVHHVPIINLIPGQGMGITDFVLDNNTLAIIATKHSELSYDSIEAKAIAEQTTLIIRLFNFYFKKAIALLITTIFISKQLLSKWNSKN